MFSITFGLAALHDATQGIGRAEIDAHHFTHVKLSKNY